MELCFPKRCLSKNTQNKGITAVLEGDPPGIGGLHNPERCDGGVRECSKIPLGELAGFRRRSLHDSRDL